MAGKLENRLLSLNPLKCTGTVLPATVLLCVKLIVFYLFLTGKIWKVPEPFLPMLPFFDHIPWPFLFRRFVQVLILGAAIGLLLNRYVRACCLVVGLVFILKPMMARDVYLNSGFYCGCVFILTGLYHAKFSLWFFRAQFVLMYFGSGLNKLLDPDWRNGQYMEYWMVELIVSNSYIMLASLFPPKLLSIFMGWATIIGELGLAFGFAIPRFTRWAIWTAILFHSASVFLAGHPFGVFFGAILASYLVLIEWPGLQEVRIVYDRNNTLARVGYWISQRIDFDSQFLWCPKTDETDRISNTWFGLNLNGTRYEGMRAFNMWLLLNPLTYCCIAVVLALPSLGLFFWVRTAVMALALCWFFPLISVHLNGRRLLQPQKNPQ